MSQSDLRFPLSSNIKVKGLVIVIIFSLTMSCVSLRKAELLRDSNRSPKSFVETEYPDYRLKSNDELFIKINSLDEAAASIFSNAAQQPLSLDPYAASMLSYSVDKEGYLLLPVIGNIFVKDKTLSQVSEILKDSLHQILNQPVITIKLVNRFVSVLGEVNSPGHYPYSQEKLSVFDAIGLAGHISDYGDPNNVVIIRNEDGKNMRTNIDLSNSDILGSTYYYIRPNDILYVKPLRNKFWVMRQVPLSILFSTITTGLLIYNIFN